MKHIITSTIAMSLLLASCQENGAIFPQEDTVEKEMLTLPHAMVLVDNKGRSLDVTLIRRSENFVYFKKENNTKLYEYRINNLSNESKTVIESMPIDSDPIQAKKGTGDSKYIAGRKREIETLQKKIVDLKHDLPGLSGGSPRRRGIQSEIERINLRINRERQAINDYHAR